VTPFVTTGGRSQAPPHFHLLLYPCHVLPPLPTERPLFAANSRVSLAPRGAPLHLRPVTRYQRSVSRPLPSRPLTSDTTRLPQAGRVPLFRTCRT
jgi:hypothetical protein